MRSDERKPKRQRGGNRGGQQRDYFSKRDIFLSRMASILQVSPKLARSFFSQRAISAIRLNNLAENPEKIKKLLESKGVELKQVPWSKYTYVVPNMDKSDLAKLNAYKNGLFYIQSLSSMIPVIILDPKPGDKILDMTAAPGSKTSQIASLTDNEALITANDSNYERAKNMEKLMKMFYVDNIQISVSDGAKYGEQMKEQFDKVLLDAPCSGEGLIYLQSDNPLRFWSVKKVKKMSYIQKDLIVGAYEALKPGGSMVYSTCTLEPEENEAVVSYLLEKYPKAELVNVSLDSLPEFADYKRYVERGISKWSGMEFNKFMGKTLRVVPGEVMQGFYIAHISKPE